VAAGQVGVAHLSGSRPGRGVPMAVGKAGPSLASQGDQSLAILGFNRECILKTVVNG
jgi:hypothetical protein